MATVSTILTRALLQALEREGVARADICGELDESCLMDPDRRVGIESFVALLRRSVQALVEPGLGWLVAAEASRGSFRGIEYLVRSAPTLGQGLERLVQFHRLLFGTDLVQVIEHDDVVEYTVAALSDESTLEGRVLTEMVVGLLLALGAKATGIRWQPRLVRFRHAAHRDADKIRELAQEVGFDAHNTGIVIDRATLALAMREQDAELHSTLLGFMEDALAEIPREGVWGRRVREALGSMLGRRDPSLELTARELGVSSRTLQLRLEEEASSYREILDELRFGLARRYLTREDLSMPLVAELLGYSDASAFHRAFRRWSGLTPGRYRREVVSGSVA